MKIGFLVQDILSISGGGNVILEYANELTALGDDVHLISKESVETPCWHRLDPEVCIQSISQAQLESFDVVFATWWPTVFDLGRLKAHRYGYFMQSLESRFHSENYLKMLNRVIYQLPLLILTEAHWIKELIHLLRPDAEVICIENGLNKKHFPVSSSVFPPAFSSTTPQNKIKVLVEGKGSIEFKGVAMAFELLNQVEGDFSVGWLTTEKGRLSPQLRGQPVTTHFQVPIDKVSEVYRQYDLLLKLSRVEGVFGPPLEMFSQGGTAICLNVSGADQYLVHGKNSLVVPIHKISQAKDYIEALIRHPDQLQKLRAGALETARNYPTWSEQILKFKKELLQIKPASSVRVAPAELFNALYLARESLLPSFDAPFELKNITDFEYALIKKLRKWRSGFRKVGVKNRLLHSLKDLTKSLVMRRS